MKKRTIIVGLLLVCLIPLVVPGYALPPTQNTDDASLIKAVQARVKEEIGEPNSYDYKVLNKFELTAAEQQMLENKKIDLTQSPLLAPQAYVAVYKPEDGWIEQLYRVSRNSSRELNVDRNSDVIDHLNPAFVRWLAFSAELKTDGFMSGFDLTVTELIKLRKVAEEFSDALLKKSDVAALFDMWCAPDLFSDVKKLSWTAPSRLFATQAEAAKLLSQISESERRRLIAAWCNVFMRLTEYSSSPSVADMNEQKHDVAFNKFVRQSGIATNEEEFEKIFETPVTTKQQLLDRLSAWEAANRAWLAYLQTTNVYDSDLYQLTMRSWSKRIVFANKFEPQKAEMAPKQTVYATNSFILTVVFSEFKGQMKIVGIGPVEF